MKRWFVGRVVLALAMMSIFAAAVPTASAQDKRDFTLVNGSPVVLVNLYISGVDENDWGDDVLGADVLSSGGSVPIVFSGRATTCLYDIMVRGQGGEEGYLYKVDLCSISTVTFS